MKTLSQYARDNHLNRVKENIDTIYALLAVAQRKAITAYTLTHPDSCAIADRVFINFRNDQTELPLLKSIYNNFAPQIKKSVGGKSIEDLIKGIERVQIGNDAPDFSLPDDKGKEVQFSTFKGKYILLYFWASWCVPCRAESPSLVSAFQKYNDKNFIIVSISLDTDKYQWMKAIKDDQFTWPQLSSSLKGYMENGVRQLYNV